MSTIGQTAFSTCFSTSLKERCHKSPQSLTPQKPTIQLLFCAFLNSHLLHPLDLFNFFFERKTWWIQLEAYNEKAKTAFKKRTGTSTRSTPLENTPISNKNHGLFQKQCYPSPHPKILTLSSNTRKQTLPQHRAVPAQSETSQCFVCNHHLNSLGCPHCPVCVIKLNPGWIPRYFCSTDTKLENRNAWEYLSCKMHKCLQML